MWQVFDDLPMCRPWKIVPNDVFAQRLADDADRVHLDHIKIQCKVFKTVGCAQFTVRSAMSGNLIPVESVLQYEYDQHGRPFALWGYARVLRPKRLGLAITVIRTRQRVEMLDEQLARRAQLRMITPGMRSDVR